MRIVGVLLAAGSGSRFGGDKLRHPIPPREFDPHDPMPAMDAPGNATRAQTRDDGTARIDTSANREGSQCRVALGVVACRSLVAALPETLAVVRPEDATLGVLLRGAGARIVPCADAGLGMGHSLACAIQASRDADGWVVALADMPWVRVATIRAVADALRAGAHMVATSHAGRRGNPVGFAGSYGATLASLTGDRGARDLVAAAGDTLALIDTGDEGVLRDVDVRGDLRESRDST
jgi:molybdenum cofactor cytidylyltransferase